MFWEEWDEYESYWYAPMKSEDGREFSLFIHADSPVDFLAVANTRSAYKKLLENLDSIRDEMINDIMENSRAVFKKKRQRLSAEESLKNNLRLFSIKIYSDLSSNIEFTGIIPEDEDPDEVFYASLNEKGELVEAGIEDF